MTRERPRDRERLRRPDRARHLEDRAPSARAHRARLGLSHRERSAPPVARGGRDGDEGRRTPFELVWRNDELTDPPGQRPPGHSEEHRMQSRILALDPPRKLAFSFGISGEVSFELEPKGKEVLLTVVHRRLPDRATMLKVSAGWHMHLDVLVARTRGEEPAPFWDGWSRLRDEYDTRQPA